MSKELKVAVVGCGQISDGHVSEIQKIDCAELVAVCDLEPLMAEQVATRFHVPRHFSDYQAMLSECKPDVVHICTPPGPHLMLGKMAADAGAHVYVEKPLALNYADSVELIDYVLAADRKITVGHNSQFDPPMIDLRRLVEKGVLGECIHIESYFGYNLAGPFGDVIMGSSDHWVHGLPGKLFQNNINHMLNKVTEFLSDEKPQILATGWMQGGATQFGDVRDEMQDELRVTIRGEKVSAYGTFTSHVKPLAQFARYYGTRSIIHVDFTSRTVTVDRGATLPSAIGRLAAGFGQTMQYAKSSLRNTWRFVRSDYHFFAGMNCLFRLFYDSILHDKPLPIPVNDMRRIAWMMDEIFRQIRQDRPQ